MNVNFDVAEQAGTNGYETPTSRDRRCNCLYRGAA
jgi:hypothetical protein